MNLKNYLSIDKLNKNNFKKIFFYRICGTGMGAAACLLKEAGFQVEGADSMFYPPMSTYLERSGINYYKLSEIDIQSKLKEYDLIVVGNVVAGSSTEARQIEDSAVPFCSFPAAIGAFVLKDKTVIGLSGTHGKTTTTYLGAQVFEALGEDCGYFIGGVMDDRPPSKLGKSKYFFIESDEYDSAYFEKYSKFQSYCINKLVITSLEYDHADIFSSIEDIKNEFRNVIPKVDSVIGCLGWSEIENLKKEFNKLSTEISWIGYGPGNTKIIEESEMGVKFELTSMNETHIFKTNVIGLHNIYNLSAIIEVALSFGFSPLSIQNSLSNLQMVKRRQEFKGKFQGAICIDDFAHHPTAVIETIKAIKVKYPNKKINVFLEPGSATARSDIFQKEFLSSLLGASMCTIIKPSRPTTAKNHGDLNVELIKVELCNKGIDTIVVTDLDSLLLRLKGHSNEHVVNLVMSNGACLGLWSSDFAKNLSS